MSYHLIQKNNSMPKDGEFHIAAQSFWINIQTQPDGSKIAVLAFKSSGRFEDPAGMVIAEFPMTYQMFNDFVIVAQKIREKNGELPPDPNGYMNY
jgi:hypothetical protein